MNALDELDIAIYEALSGRKSVAPKPRAPSRTVYRCEPRFLMPKNIALEIAYALGVCMPRPIPILVRAPR